MKQDKRHHIRVKLLANEEEDFPEEYGTMVTTLEEAKANNGCATVWVDEEYLVNEFDDGLREVPLDQIKILEEGDEQ